MKFSSLVPVNRGKNIPVIDYLVSRFTYFSKDDWLSHLREGKLSIDGTNAREDSLVNGGQCVVYDAGEIIEPPADLSFTILYEDEWLLVVNKPGNLLIHRAGRSFTHNLMFQLRSVHAPAYPEAHSVHRLDRNTSGTVLISKNSEIQATLSSLFREQQIRKQYIAICEGEPRSLPDTICQPIGPSPDTSEGCKFCIDPQGKDAMTRIVSAERLGTNLTLFNLMPITGRTHQLRVHLASIGHPIFGDRTYGSSRSFREFTNDTVQPSEESPFCRHALHCSQLEFYHPWKKTDIICKAELPDDMQKIVERYRGRN